LCVNGGRALPNETGHNGRFEASTGERVSAPIACDVGDAPDAVRGNDINVA
jgi:hypothetical protein